ncbi:enoyl-CoA hydratase/isomerase family protein [Sulfitobacter sp. M13]|jgi:enoyl-CoA hydratase/carnithine racemase|tara:strand:+ start:416 stop:823 length:408 start_codon:yes stop_codon:yes gene_type:complete
MIQPQLQLYQRLMQQNRLTPDGGGTVGLTRTVGTRHALRFLLAEDKFDCTDALQTGLVTKIATKGTLEETTKQFAERLASFAQVVPAGTKHLLRSAENTEISQQLENEHTQLEAAMSGDLFQNRLREIINANGVS